MRTSWLVVVCAWVLGCGGDDGPPAPDANLLGAECMDTAGCGGYTCVEGACTTACEASSDCRSGTECRNVEGAFACVEKKWTGGAGEYHTNCAVNGTADCASGWTCIQIRASDPNSYCSDDCDTDRDCPPEYLCGDPGDGSQKCVRRTMCTACELDEQCVTPIYPDGKCEDDAAGGKACTKGCTAGGETCPPLFDCVGSGADAHCVHKTGSCVGDGSQCDPCTVEEDCADTTGSTCIRLYFSGETYCAEPCAGGVCPAPLECYNVSGSPHCLGPASAQNSCSVFFP